MRLEQSFLSQGISYTGVSYVADCIGLVIMVHYNLESLVASAAIRIVRGFHCVNTSSYDMLVDSACQNT